mmetsp:Transcript_58665/g.96857  ORF Transcript_58665/g.96857 Transcript_58665/m.96857 type:complete len:337 (+) Transcript_58665:90-1100(+)|eukprot:CAMPEP_0119336194 /NCGR_PEP_ID=MMETSP1333-20130426/91314_1 /TAXON_ID=418940 /ORGANISM="Scyphosphaera apsteinii, Strain RCC1455" /LENGTH=336 /DNA_ID=CAMNT_0007346949 /DNA_START=90 /DNA_END=1100 /DNA_ORIENTATION=-
MGGGLQGQVFLWHPAVVVTVCNGVDKNNEHGWVQLVRAKMLACSLRVVHSNVTLVALARGFAAGDLEYLHAAGYNRVIDLSSVPASAFALRPLFSWMREDAAKKEKENTEVLQRLWPWGHGNVQERKDGECTSLKLHVWDPETVGEYSTVLHSDTDVIFLTDPLPWLNANRHEYFVASKEVQGRPYTGMNSHMFLLTPNKQVFRILVESATTGHFMPHTNTEQDVIETVFPWRTTTLIKLPSHMHLKTTLLCKPCSSFITAKPSRSRRRTGSVAGVAGTNTSSKIFIGIRSVAGHLHDVCNRASVFNCLPDYCAEVDQRQAAGVQNRKVAAAHARP